MVSASNLLNAAKDIGTFVMITFGTYFVAIIVLIIAGYMEETVISALGLNASGTAATNIGTLFTALYTAVIAITAIITVVTGLLTLNVVLKAFGVNLKLNFGSGSRV